MDIKTFKRQQRGGVGIIGFSLKESDLPSIISVCNTHHKLLFFTDAGKAYWINAYEISKQERLGRGIHIRRYIGTGEDEKVVAIISTPDFSGEVVVLNEDGHIKRVLLSDFENAKRAGIIASSGRIAHAKLCDGYEIVISSRNGQLARFPVEKVPVYGRTAAGVKSIKLRRDDEIANIAVVKGSGDIFTLTEKGYGKRTPVERYRLTARGSLGVINIRVSEKTGKVIFTEYVEGDEDLLIFSMDGYALKVAVKGISIQGRTAGGVRVCRKEVACATLIR
jgi:DNA gyrase subunit A